MTQTAVHCLPAVRNTVLEHREKTVSLLHDVLRNHFTAQQNGGLFSEIFFSGVEYKTYSALLNTPSFATNF